MLARATTVGQPSCTAAWGRRRRRRGEIGGRERVVEGVPGGSHEGREGRGVEGWGMRGSELGLRFVIYTLSALSGH